ncbi:MAG TPA: DMT family transporter [Candidatus Edwardsbacteria bacterium]|nr:DMT family transporter [Candidatus Edwardsbacteria bacterium]
MGSSKPPYFWPVMAAGIAGISFGSILIKLATAGPSPAAPLAIAFYRLGFTALLLLPLFLAQGRAGRVRVGDLLWAGLAGAFLSLHFVLWIYSLGFTTVTSSVVFVTTNPLFVTILGWLLLREKPSRGLLVAVALVIAGGLVIAGRSLAASDPRANIGNLLALGGAVMASGYLLVGRRLRAHMDIMSYGTVCYGITAAILLAACLAFHVPLRGFAGINYLWFLLAALGPQVLGHTSFNWGLKHWLASRIAMLTITEPVGAAVLAWLILRQVPTLYEIGGGLLILSGVYLTIKNGE